MTEEIKHPLTEKEILLEKHKLFKRLQNKMNEIGNDPNLPEEEKEAQIKTLGKESQDIQKEIIRLEERNYHEGEFDGVFSHLFFNEPFLGSVSLRITKKADFSCPTAYVAVRRNGHSPELVMGFNPIFFRELRKEQKEGVACHEFYHVVFQHLFGRTVHSVDKNIHRLHNYATDMAINSILGKNRLPEFALMPGVTPKDYDGKPLDTHVAKAIGDAPLMESSEYYFKLLREAYKKDQEQDKKNGGDGNIEIQISTLDDHDQWGDGDGDDIPEELRDEISNKIKEAIEKGVMNADRSNQWGSTPHKIQEEIRKLIAREVDWRSVLRNFIGRVRSSERSSTVKKINKKMPYIFPGVKRKTISKFACFVDQSGSMSDDDIIMLFAELESLNREIEIDVYHFDTEIDVENKMVWKKGQAAPKRLRTRCGGTDFNAIANYCNDPRTPKYDGVVILTDGYADKMGAIRQAKVLWVITETGTMGTVRPGDLAVQMKKSSGKFRTY